MADVTFADALAALRAECGEPTDTYVVSACARMWWAAPWSREYDDEDGVMLVETVMGGVEIVAMRGPGVDARWVLAGTGTLTPLADAVRDAGAWLRGRDERVPHRPRAPAVLCVRARAVRGHRPRPAARGH